MPLITLAMTGQLLAAWTDVQTGISTECAVLTIAYESRGENERGQRAVAEVLLNRMETSVYSEDVCEVVTQDNQFEWYRRSLNKTLTPLTDAEYLQAARVWFSYEYGNTKREVLLPCHTTFINPALVKKRRGGYLPSWWTSGNYPRTIGNHEFRCEPRVIAAALSKYQGE